MSCAKASGATSAKGLSKTNLSTLQVYKQKTLCNNVYLLIRIGICGLLDQCHQDAFASRTKMQHGLPEYPPPQGAGHCTRHTSLVWEVIMHSESSLALAGSTSSHEPCMQAFDQRPRLYRDHAQKWQPPQGNPGGHRPHPKISQQISGQCQMPRKSQTGDFPEQGKPYVEGQDLSLSQRAYDSPSIHEGQNGMFTAKPL